MSAVQTSEGVSGCKEDGNNNTLAARLFCFVYVALGDAYKKQKVGPQVGCMSRALPLFFQLKVLTVPSSTHMTENFKASIVKMVCVYTEAV